MNRNALKIIALALVLLLVAGASYWFGRIGTGPATTTSAIATPPSERKPLYWYDPMSPQQRFDKPGKSPFMDMQLVPKYADDDTGPGVRIDPTLAQNLGLRVAPVETGSLAPSIDAVASVGFNERDVAVIQARTHGFVERVYRLAAGDVIAQGAPIADVLVPEWAAAQREFLALQAAGEGSLLEATRERLALLGMPEELIQRIERTRQPHPIVTIVTPSGGVIQALDVRTGMTLAPGMTLARVNGFASVWLEAAVPEAQAGALKPGATVEARLAAFPGEVFTGKVAAILPEANVQTRTLRVRAEFDNRAGRLKPGLYAQMRILVDAPRQALLVPSEAVIRTGKRALVIVAGADHRFLPVEIEIGAEADGKTAVLKGLSAGQKVVVSGQFLIDSEASLKGALDRIQERAPEPTSAGARGENKK
jgi:Cu(I)/Ag(I) efflux system membrane fusion protein